MEDFCYITDNTYTKEEVISPLSFIRDVYRMLMLESYVLFLFLVRPFQFLVFLGVFEMTRERLCRW